MVRPRPGAGSTAWARRQVAQGELGWKRLGEPLEDDVGGLLPIGQQHNVVREPLKDYGTPRADKSSGLLQGKTVDNPVPFRAEDENRRSTIQPRCAPLAIGCFRRQFATKVRKV